MPLVVSGDPLAVGATDPMEGGMGDEALEAHMQAFLKAQKAGDPRGMATAFRAASEACYDEREPPMDQPAQPPGGDEAPPL